MSVVKKVDELDGLLLALFEGLRQRDLRLVLAESCSAGLVAAMLGRVPGISQVLCGSMVVYQTDIKHEWLDIDPAILDNPTIGPVSQRATEQLACNILLRTPQANLSGAITGHLGPNAPFDLDGAVYLSVAKRVQQVVVDGTQDQLTVVHRTTILKASSPRDEQDIQGRYLRQQESARCLIDFLLETILLPDS
jgi:nicotinamide-nucleotide amidase